MKKKTPKSNKRSHKRRSMVRVNGPGGPLQLSWEQAEKLGLTKRLGLGRQDAEEKSPSKGGKKTVKPQSSAKYWHVTWYSKKREKRTQFIRPIKATSAQAAMKQARAMITNDTPVNMMAEEVFRESNPRAARAKVQNKLPQKTVKTNPPQQMLTTNQLAHLREEFGKLDNVDLKKYRGAFQEVFAGVRTPLLRQIAQGKIEWVSGLAKNAYMRRMRNPQKKNPMHPLEVGSHVAIILGGLEQVKNMISRRKTKRTRAKKNLGLISLAENLQAAEYLTKKLNRDKQKGAGSRRSNPNNGKLFEKFTGKKSEHVETGYMWPGPAPKNIDQLGRLTEIHLSNPGDRVDISKCGRGKGPCHCGSVLRFTNNPAKLCATQSSSGRPRFIIALKRPFEMPVQLNPHGEHDYGEAHTVVYKASKPHLYSYCPTCRQVMDHEESRGHRHEVKPYTGQIPFYHDLGEEGGRVPHLILTNGLLKLRGGDYTIEREGIRN